MTTHTPQAEDINKLKEIEIAINIRGLWKGFTKIFYEAPTKAYQWVALKSDKFSKKMMTGRAAIITMPLGLMIRNGATVAHDASNLEDGDSGIYMRVLSGGSALAAAAGAVWFGGTGIYTALVTKLALTGLLTKGLAAVTGAVAGAFLAIPAATAGLLVASTAIAVTATVLSVVPAVANLGTAYSRTVARWKGNKIDENALQAELAKNSISSRHERNAIEDVNSALRRLDANGQKEILAQLKQKFEPVAKPAAPVKNEQTAPASVKTAAPTKK